MAFNCLALLELTYVFAGTGYTWHDASCSGFANDCYITTDAHAWKDGKKGTAGHHSAICNNGQSQLDSTLGHAEDFSQFFCGGSLADWQRNTKGQDMHSSTCTNAKGECGSAMWLQRARELLWAGQGK